MTVNHLFLIDPLNSLNLALDSSLRMMFALEKIGHKIWVCEPRHLYWTTPEVAASAKAQKLSFNGDAQKPKIDREESHKLDYFNAVHMRKDPPYDLDYITTTWMLDTAGTKTKVYNKPEALRSYNEKLLIFKFPQFAKPGLFSSNVEDIVNFIKTTAKGDGIIKPLHLFGGRGVQRVTIKTSEDEKNARQLLASETFDGKTAKLVQGFDSSIFSGEVRAFTAFGEPISWCLKKPATGEYLANTRTGATLHKYNPSQDEFTRVTKFAGILNDLGMPFVGFDIIGGFISEVNITSPRLLQAPEDTEYYYGKIATLIDQDLAKS
jgi:glutathione synthase